MRKVCWGLLYFHFFIPKNIFKKYLFDFLIYSFQKIFPKTISLTFMERFNILCVTCYINDFHKVWLDIFAGLAVGYYHDQPAYLSELIHPYTSSRNTRRNRPKLKFMHIPTFNCTVHKSNKHFSNSSSHYAPVLWNSFPLKIRTSPSVTSSRKHLKTRLFNSSFPTFCHTHNSGLLTITAP